MIRISMKNGRSALAELQVNTKYIMDFYSLKIVYVFHEDH